MNRSGKEGDIEVGRRQTQVLIPRIYNVQSWKTILVEDMQDSFLWEAQHEFSKIMADQVYLGN